MHWITELCTPKVCTFFKKKRLFFNAGIEITIGDDWKIVEEKLLKNFFVIWKKKPDGNKGNMKERYLPRKLWTPMILNLCLLLKQHDKWLVKNSWKTLQTSCGGWHSSIKTFRSEKLLTVLFWNWKQCTAIMKRISVTWDYNAVPVT